MSVVRSNERNAFCLPGGKIVVYTGIIPIAKNEAGLATVLGHEMAHATSRHGAERLFRSELTQTVLTGIQGSLADMDPKKRQVVHLIRTFFFPTYDYDYCRLSLARWALVPNTAFPCRFHANKSLKLIISAYCTWLVLVMIQEKQFVSGNE